MDSLRTVDRNAGMEINLKDFFKKIFRYKFLFLLSLVTCLGVAYFYTKIATPIYEVGTSILIDASGNGQMGESRYLDGDVSLVETEKNIYNEIGVLKSYELVRQSIEELNYRVNYMSGQWYAMKESFGYFPFEVTVLDSMTQIYGVPFAIQLLSDDNYQLTIKEDEFYVSNPSNNGARKVEKSLEFSGIYSFGQVVEHPYFNFVLNKPSYPIIEGDFEGEELQFVLNSIDGLTNEYLAKLEVNQLDIQASILQLRTQGPVLEKEVNFLEKLTSNYIAANLEKRDEIASSKEDFIRNQLGSISDSLAIAESKMERFKTGTSSANIEATMSSSMNKIDRLETDLNQIELNVKYYKQLLRYISNAKNINKIIAPSAVGINDPLLNENILELKNLYSERTRKKFYKGEKSYDLEILDQQVNNTTRALKENVRNLISSSELALKDKNGRISKIEGKLKSLPKNEMKLGSHQRKSDLYENVYNYLNQELVKTGIARAENLSDSRVLDAARMIGDKPISPQKKLIYLLGGLIGLLLPMLWVIFANSVDDSIQNGEHLERISPLPVAANIAHLSPKYRFGFGKDNSWQVEESFRDLSANLQFLNKDPKKNVIGLTSTISGEGKTFCAGNLAISLATSGKRVLLIDTDFRTPSVFQAIAADKAGLSAYLKGEIEYAEKIMHTHPDVANLDYIPTHAYANNPHELLSNPRLDTLLGELRHHYDFIIIDSPAVGLVSDYLLITKNIDIHLFVLRHKVSKLEYIDDLMKLKEKGKMTDAYFVYNDVPSESYKYGVSYYKKKRDNFRGFVTRMFSF